MSSSLSTSSFSNSSGDLFDSDLYSCESKICTFLEATASSLSVPLNHLPPQPRLLFLCRQKEAIFPRRPPTCHRYHHLFRPQTLPLCHSLCPLFLKSKHPLNPLNPNPNRTSKSPEERFVFSSSGIFANIPIGYPLDSTFSKFHLVEFTPLIVNFGDCLCFVVVRFNQDWSGFCEAVALENWFKVAGFGREELVKGKLDEVGKGDLYGWMGREEDFEGDREVRKYLRRATSGGRWLRSRRWRVRRQRRVGRRWRC